MNPVTWDTFQQQVAPNALDEIDTCRQRLDAAIAHRDSCILFAFDEDIPIPSIATLFGLTKQRVHQIVIREGTLRALNVELP